ncbi:MAG: peptidoglycan D,D-transpeptidase FtsI family protein, partial [Actinomycetota bacterium]
MTRPPARRLVALLVVLLFGFGGVVARLAVLQVRESGQLTELGAQQRMRPQALPADRGQILDRNGTPLAMTLEARDVYANPALVTDPAGEATTISQLLGLKESVVEGQLRLPGTFVYIDRQVDRDVAHTLEDRHLPGIGFLPVEKRYYPAGPVASQLLGFVGVDGTGITGLEQQYDGVL